MSSKYKIEKEWDNAGLPCVVLMTDMGHRCGYVGVPKGHKWYGTNYDDVQRSDGGYIEVHGGLTYGREGGKGYPSEKKEGFFWFGFDCAHYGDSPDPSINPHYAEMMSDGGEIRSLDYCVVECEKLARQLNDIPEPPEPDYGADGPTERNHRLDEARRMK